MSLYEKMRSIFNKFLNLFNFESGIDLTDKTAVLYRRNVVIKNVIFMSNLLYSIMMTVISLTVPGNWGLTIAFYPLTLIINSSIKNLISDDKDYLKQKIAMYIAVFYMFLSSVLLYFRLRTMDVSFSEPGHNSFGEAGYILIYYAIIVISLYQDKKMLATAFKFIFATVTILHFVLTYDIIHTDYSNGLFNFVSHFFATNEFKDIFIRTVILLIFMIADYSLVSMGSYVIEMRSKELKMRKTIQSDFNKYLGEIFNTTISSEHIDPEEANQIGLVSNMSQRLASIMGLAPDVCEEIANFASIHKTNFTNVEISNASENNYKQIAEQAELGSKIIKRLELRRRCADICRTHTLDADTDEYRSMMIETSLDQKSQIIFICEMYITLRSIRNYKRPYSHEKSITLLQQEFEIYLDKNILSRFIKFNQDFCVMYDKY